MTSIDSPSLRERRRSETWSALNEAAASLALDEGLEHATVEAITSRAQVSPRTFFNYFASKEHAVLGIRQPSLSEIEIPERVHGDLLDEVCRLLVAVLQSSFGDDKAYELRQQLIERYPQLIQRRMETIAEVESLVRGVVDNWLAQDQETAGGLAGFSRDEAARMLVTIAAVPVRFTVHSPGGKRAPKRHANASDDLKDFRPALGLFRELLGRVK